MKKFSFKKIMSIILCFCIVMTYLPATVAAAAEPQNSHYNRVVDKNTMDLWREYFPIKEIADDPSTAANEYKPLTTANAGGVWTDKTVLTSAELFANLKNVDGAAASVIMQDAGKNFLTVLSAIAANKEVVGYSTVPTDTVFVLDLSGSMSENSVDNLVEATNDAIRKLQSTNENNRVGVVLYSGSSSDRTYNNAVARLMPIDRYTTTNANGDFIQYTGGTVRLARSWGNQVQVSGTKAIVSESKSHGGATYIQAGLWEAYKMFDEVPDSEIKIGENNWQSGDYRMPIVVLMSDGAPTLGTSYFTDVENSTYGYGNQNASKANFGDGNDTGSTIGQGFLVQLTASYVKNRIENKYKVHSEYGAGRSLFYTLGFNLSTISNATARASATAVLNPDSSIATDALWATYNSLTATNNTMEVEVEGRNGGTTDIVVTKNSYATGKSYVDKYFSASGTGLADAFDDIVAEIILQSRYYPTHLEGGNPDFSGYIEFTDTMGEYMEVKHVNGILLGDTLFDGHAMASKLADMTADGLGTPENPTELGHEFIGSVKTRLGISDTATAQLLVKSAYDAGQLEYTDENNWSNYIAWFADASGNYLGHWNESNNQAVPANAVYKIKSYGFLGQTGGSIKNSDMMYMTVQVRTDIATGTETVSWKIPAALVPMVTYLVDVDGTSVDTATNVRIAVEDENVTPIRLIYETGLRSDLNEFNITRITDSKHLANDSHTRVFWNNYFMIDGADHTKHVTALSEFKPNKENERFYYTFDSAVYNKVGDTYELVTENEGIDFNSKTYYHRRYIFSTESPTRPVFFYEPMSAASAKAAFDNHFVDNFKNLENVTVGAWVVPKGTPARELEMYKQDKEPNSTNSAHMVFYPYLTEQNNVVAVDMNLGNNGMLSVTPATGIKISKTVDIFENGTSDTFKFRITLNGVSGNFDCWLTDLDATPTGQASNASFVNGVFEVELKKDQTFWITGIPAGTAYTVEEISDNADYKIKSVHVNGVSTGTAALGTVTQYLIDDIDFVNTAIGEGDLVITKRVIDQNGNTVDVNDSVEFTAEVTLTNASGAPVSDTFETSKGTINVPANGKFTVTLTDGASFVVRGIDEETRYDIREISIPAGFTFNANESSMSGVVDSSTNDQAVIVNNYEPTKTDGSNVQVKVFKEISGNRTDWQTGESYTFNLELIHVSRAATLVGTKTISATDNDKSALFSLSGENYTEAGTYVYRITEETGSQGGVTYDTAERRFTVVVADSDMDGDLEIVAVNNNLNTTVSGTYVVTANFNNVYAPTGSASTTINIQKSINDNHSLSGFRFALFNADPSNSSDVDELIRSNVTGADGKASITLTYAANRATMAGTNYEYYLAEIKGDNANITYTDKVYKVVVTVTDNGDGTISATNKVFDGNSEISSAVPFVNVYTPSSADYLTFSGKKVISTNNRVINAGEFEFKIETTNGAPLPANTTVSNDANGNFIFPAIRFDSATTEDYKYVITEVNTGIGGFIYDTARYEISVKVTDAAAILTAEITSFKKIAATGTTNETEIVFDNKYSATPATVAVNGTKLLTGKTMEENEFEFTISAATTGAPTPAYSAAKNDAKGKFTFGDITFTTAGTFVYNIVETQGSDSHYTYDKSVYTLTVTVTDNSEGTLSASYALTKNGADSSEIVFSNIYTPDPIVYDIYDEFGGTKVLDGRTLEEGEFEFRLINAITGQQIGETVKNDASGEFRFPQITINEVGTYHYKITEVIGDEKGITYDTNQFHVVLGVQQETNGRFTLVREELHVATIETEDVGGVPTEVTKYTDITGNGTVEFKNSYAADATKINISGNKMLSGRALKAEEFSFNLYNVKEDAASGSYVKGELVDTAKNTADGTFTFDTLEIMSAGTYRFFVTEDATAKIDNVTYDETVYMVVVTVTDNLDGTLSAQYAYQTALGNSETLTFLNVYTPPKAPEIPKTGDDSNIWMWMALAFVSTLGMFTLRFFRTEERIEEE